MKLEQLFEMNAHVKQIADQVINDFAEEKSFNHDMIVAKVKDMLSKDPAFKDNADKLNRALVAVSNYVKPEA